MNLFDLKKPQPGDNLKPLAEAIREGIRMAKQSKTMDSCGYCGATGDWLDDSCTESGWPFCRYCKGV